MTAGGQLGFSLRWLPLAQLAVGRSLPPIETETLADSYEHQVAPFRPAIAG
ncbi:MAG: hypothetical protein E6861_00120 [Stenotrophomonas maltophilia]|nr:hypothetical protein [Stenotrophomonas maltophilia]